MTPPVVSSEEPSSRTQLADHRTLEANGLPAAPCRSCHGRYGRVGSFWAGAARERRKNAGRLPVFKTGALNRPSVTPPAFLTARADFCPKSNPIQCSENAIRAIIRTSTSEGYERIYDGSTGPDAHDARAGRIPGASSLTRCAGGYGWVVSSARIVAPGRRCA